MINNDEEGANPQIPDKIKNAIEKYNNQITDLEFEVKRLQKFLAEKKVELFNTSNEIKSNNDIIEKLDNGKQLKADKVLVLEKDIAKKEIRSKEIEDENIKLVEEITEKKAKIMREELDLNNREEDYKNRNTKLLEDISNNRKDKEEIERKKQIILETINKL